MRLLKRCQGVQFYQAERKGNCRVIIRVSFSIAHVARWTDHVRCHCQCHCHRRGGKVTYSPLSEQAAVIAVTSIRGREIAGSRKHPDLFVEAGRDAGGNYYPSCIDNLPVISRRGEEN